MVQYGEGGAQIPGPVAEGGEPAPVVVHQILEVEQGPAAREESAQQGLGAGLLLVGVPEEDVAVCQRGRLVGEFLESEDDGVRRGRDPGSGPGDTAAGFLVRLDREDPLR